MKVLTLRLPFSSWWIALLSAKSSEKKEGMDSGDVFECISKGKSILKTQPAIVTIQALTLTKCVLYFSKQKKVLKCGHSAFLTPFYNSARLVIEEHEFLINSYSSGTKFLLENNVHV